MDGSVLEIESPDPDRTRARAVFTLNGGKDWRNFKQEDYEFAINRRRQMGDHSLPMGYDQQGSDQMDESMRANSSLDTSGAAVSSPRGELSQHSVTSSAASVDAESQVSMVDLTGVSSEEDRESASFSPFLAKKPRVVLNVGSTSSDDIIMETSMTETQVEVNKVDESKEGGEKEKEKEKEAANLEESVTIISQEGGSGEEDC